MPVPLFVSTEDLRHAPVLRLHYLQSLTQQEVAEALGIPIGTVKSRLAYGLRCLRRT